MQKLLNLLKPYSVDAYEAGEAIPFGSHLCWTRRAAMEWTAMYPAWCDVVIWRAASFNRLPRIEAIRKSI